MNKFNKIQNVKRVVFLSIFIVVLTVFCSGIVKASWCYQETTNVSHASDGDCSLDYSGNYTVENPATWSNPSNAYDGDWGTSTFTDEIYSYVYVNYTKPSGALNSSLWKIKSTYYDGSSTITIFQNYSLDSNGCWDYDSNKLSFRAYGYENSDCGGYSIECHNSSGWYVLNDTIPWLCDWDYGRLYEEAMWWATNVTSTSEGPNNPGTMANDSSIGTVPWIDENNAKASDNNYAYTSRQVSTYYTYYLKATNFSFSIPTGTTINGILVKIERKSAPGITTQDYAVKIVKSNGSIGSENKANLGTNWPTSDAYTDYGGDNDLWSENWTASDINNANFGVVLQAVSSGCDPPGCYGPYVDHIRVTVYYSENTCTYGGSGDWIVNASDNCIISTNTELSSNTLYIEGTGTFTILANITVDKVVMDLNAQIINKAGDGNALIIKL